MKKSLFPALFQIMPSLNNQSPPRPIAPDSSTQIVEAIWPTSSVPCRNDIGTTGVLPLRTFIQETLRRSRTSFSTLQVALYYLVLIKPHVPSRDFTMEQPDDCYASRALQCGRRMFLAALILASKYLQDRNYSARAWSKISGLNTQEINQNEMAFVAAVDWKLHITDEVYNRWTDCVVKHSPSQPPSPGGCAQTRLFERQCEDFKSIILQLAPEVDNLDDILRLSPSRPRHHHPSSATISPRSLGAPARERGYAGPFRYDYLPFQHPSGKPAALEPTPVSVYTPGRPAPALGLLPTPRPTPQSSGYSTPAASAASHLLRRPSSMSLAMAQANSVSAAQCLDRWPASTASTCATAAAAPAAAPSSPQSYFATFAPRRSSLANTISTASSPESMISDSSRTSRSSSISSASSLVSAPSSSKLDVQARCRYAKLYAGDRMGGLRPTVASVPEDYEEGAITSSPESYTGPAGKDFGRFTVETPLGRREREADTAAARESINDAARALQQLQNYRQGLAPPTVPPTSVPVQTPSAKAGSKRSRPVSMETPSLQENVRDILAGRYPGGEDAWSDTVIRSRPDAPKRSEQVPVRPNTQGARKRVCCSTEATRRHSGSSSLHPSMDCRFGGPGMWEGILN